MVRKTFFSIFILVTVCGVYSCTQEGRKTAAEKDNKEISLPDFSSIDTKDVFVYNCGDSLQFTAHVTKDSTWLFLSDTTVKVLPVEAGSGAKYEGSLFLYWSKGSEAILQRPQGSFMTCNTIPEEKAWQAAKIRGVDFRALGQEPGWHLEIKDDNNLRYVGNYGKDTLVADVSKPEETKQGTVYNAQAGSHSIEIEIADEPCTDSMSGFKFPSTVTVTVDGKTYRGCGRELS